jgi:hypothetical protein
MPDHEKVPKELLDYFETLDEDTIDRILIYLIMVMDTRPLSKWQLRALIALVAKQDPMPWDDYIKKLFNA